MLPSPTLRVEFWSISFSGCTSLLAEPCEHRPWNYSLPIEHADQRHSSPGAQYADILAEGRA